MSSDASSTCTPECPPTDSDGTPAPGIYERISFSTYATWKALNASTFCEGFHEDGISMQRLEAVLSGRLTRKESDAFRVGRALHTRLLEPEVYERDWLVSGPCSVLMKGGEREGEPCAAPGWRYHPERRLWTCGRHRLPGYEEPANYVMQDEARNIEEIRRRILTHPEGRHLHKLPGCETSLVFDCLGIRCKARLDKFGVGNTIIPDIKKVAAGKLCKWWWEKAVDENHYDVRAAFYVDAVESLTGQRQDFWWIAVEDGEPFHIAFIRAQDCVLDIGREKYRLLLDSYKRARDSGVWPGPYPDVINDWTLPHYRLTEYRNTGVI